MSTGDNARFIRNWSEVSLSNITFSCSSNEESISLQQNGILSIMAELIVMVREPRVSRKLEA